MQRHLRLREGWSILHHVGACHLVTPHSKKKCPPSTPSQPPHEGDMEASKGPQSGSSEDIAFGNWGLHLSRRAGGGFLLAATSVSSMWGLYSGSHCLCIPHAWNKQQGTCRGVCGLGHGVGTGPTFVFNVVTDTNYPHSGVLNRGGLSLSDPRPRPHPSPPHISRA